MFDGCSKLTSIYLSSFNTNKVTRMGGMFYNCLSLTSIDLFNFNCDNIKTTENMKDMFFGCNNLKIKNANHNDFKIRSQLIIDIQK